MNEQRKNLLLALYINLPIIIGIETNILKLLGVGITSTITKYTNLFLMVSIILTFLFFNRDALKKRLFIVLSIYSLLMLVSILLQNEILAIANKLAFYTFIQVIVYILFFSAMNDLKPLVKYLKLYFILGTIYSVTQLFIFNMTKLYSMSYSYSMTLLLIISLILGITKKRRDCILFFFFNFGINLIAGSRGIILCIIISLVLIPLFYDIKRKTLLKLTAIIAISLIVIILLGFAFDGVIKNSRSIKALKEDTINIYNSITGKGELKIRLSGREKYYGFVLDEIAKHPFSYKGIYNDRYYITKHFNIADKSKMFGYYPHNIILEILFQFGVLLGGVILIYLTYIVFNTGFRIRKSNNNLYTVLFIAVVSYSVGQLMVSGSYLTSSSFGLLIGYIIFIRSKKLLNE